MQKTIAQNTSYLTAALIIQKSSPFFIFGTFPTNYWLTTWVNMSLLYHLLAYLPSLLI
jgi:hypothetical protein